MSIDITKNQVKFDSDDDLVDAPDQKNNAKKFVGKN
jgi:hypothetical protein